MFGRIDMDLHMIAHSYSNSFTRTSTHTMFGSSLFTMNDLPMILITYPTSQLSLSHLTNIYHHESNKSLDTPVPDQLQFARCLLVLHLVILPTSYHAFRYPPTYYEVYNELHSTRSNYTIDRITETVRKFT